MLFSERFTLFYQNPNLFACLLCLTLLSLLWFLTLRSPLKAIVWPFLLLAFGALLLTASRGGVLALVVGLAVLFPFSKIQTFKVQLISAYICILLLSGAVLWISDDAARLFKSIDMTDGSVARRILIWKSVPGMLITAPEGWGLGNAAQAYQQWFQLDDNYLQLKHLLNSHFTWMVEISWWWRGAYVAGWTLIGVYLCINAQSCSVSRVGLAVWLAFAVASSFNATAHELTLWLIPLGWLALSLAIRRNWATLKKKIFWISSILTTLVALVTIYIMAVQFGDGSSGVIRYQKGVITLGSRHQPADLLWIQPQPEILGKFYGNQFRNLSRAGKTICILGSAQVSSPIDLSQSLVVVCHSLAIAESVAHVMPVETKYQLLVLNPQADELLENFKLPQDTRIFMGSLNPVPSENVYPDIVVLPGVEHYIRDWQNLLSR